MPLFGRRRRQAEAVSAEGSAAAAEPTGVEPAGVEVIEITAVEAPDESRHDQARDGEAADGELPAMEMAELDVVALAGIETADTTGEHDDGDHPGEPATLLVTPGAEPLGPVPRDVSELADDEEFLDLGCLRLSTAGGVLEGIEIQLQADPETGTVLALLLVDGAEKALELRGFAAARHEPLWDQVRAEIAAEAAGSGGLSQAVDGRWGSELLVQVGVQLPDGQTGVQVTRFVGIDGPRWFVRGAFLGRAAVEPETAEKLDAVLAGVTVSRGTGPMAPREPLPFVLPGQPDPVPPPDEPGRPPLEPFERGPEITEVR